MKNDFRLSIACFDYLQGLVREVERGITDVKGKFAHYFDILEAMLSQECMRRDVRLVFKKPISGMPTAEDELEALKQAYFSYVQSCRPWSRDTAEPLLLVADDARMYHKIFNKEFPATLADAEKLKDDPLKLARFMAQWNYDNTSSCILAMEFLLSLLPADGRTRNGSQTDDAMHRLYSDARRYELQIIQFALIEGDLAELQALRERLARLYFNKGRSVIQYLQPYGQTPSRWPTSVEDALLDDVSKAVEKKL